MPEYLLKGIKTFSGMEGQGLNATLYLDGRKIATILDEGCGGEMWFQFFDRQSDDEKQFEAFCQKWALTDDARSWRESMEGLGEFRAQDYMEGWTNNLVDNWATKKKFDRLSRTKTLFQIEGDGPDEWRTVTAPYSERVQQYLAKHFGAKVKTIYGQPAKAA